MEKSDKETKLTRFLEEEKGYLDDLKQVDLERNWERFVRTVQEKRGKRGGAPVWRIAAAIALLVLAGSSLLLTSRHDLQMKRVIAGEQQTGIVMREGTSITLNKGAELSYPEHPNRRKREVELSGEAFFEVEHADRSPFYVYMDGLVVRVTGTSFNIRELAGEASEVSVVSGEVWFYRVGEKRQAIRLQAGQSAIYNSVDDTFTTKAIISENHLFWKTRRLMFKDETLPGVFAELEMHYGTKIIFSDSIDPAQRWNSTHEGEQLEEILEELCIYFKLECRVEGDTIHVQSR